MKYYKALSNVAVNEGNIKERNASEGSVKGVGALSNELCPECVVEVVCCVCP